MTTDLGDQVLDSLRNIRPIEKIYLNLPAPITPNSSEYEAEKQAFITLWGGGQYGNNKWNAETLWNSRYPNGQFSWQEKVGATPFPTAEMQKLVDKMNEVISIMNQLQRYI